MLSDMQTVMVRVANSDDLPDLSRLWYEKTVLQQQTDRRWKLASDARASWSAQVADWFTGVDYRVLVGIRGNQIAGFIIGRLQAAPPGFLPKTIGAVIDMTVDIHGQPEGVGQVLFHALSNWFQQQDVHLIVTCVPHRQAVDQAFWRALGATEWVDVMWLTL